MKFFNRQKKYVKQKPGEQLKGHRSSTILHLGTRNEQEEAEIKIR